MKYCKRIALLLLSALVLGSVAACAPNEETTTPLSSLLSGSPTAVPTESPLSSTADITTPLPTTSDLPSNGESPDDHLHLDPVEFPQEFNFDDPDSIVRLFDLCQEVDGIKTTVIKNTRKIRMNGTINDNNFALTIDLSKAAGYTSPEKIVTCAKLFWYCYPLMYTRFAVNSTPRSVVLNIENEGYEIAHASGNVVHLHDQWLKKSPNDFDCLTHEFAHIIQGGWDGNYLPSDGDDTYMIERFADYCRFLYAYKNGYYNDRCWELQPSTTETSYVTGVRFWVWLDYTYSTNEIDIMNRIQQAIHKKVYNRSDWAPKGAAWDAVFEGTNAVEKDLNTLWEEYATSEICNLSSQSKRPGQVSRLLRHTPFRQAVLDRYPGCHDYWKLNA